MGKKSRNKSKANARRADNSSGVRGGGEQSGGNGEPNGDGAASTPKNQAERLSVAEAARLEKLCRESYPPTERYRDYTKRRARSALKKEEAAYSAVLCSFNAGIDLGSRPSGEAGVSRWDLVEGRMLDAIDTAVGEGGVARAAFLRTRGTDRRLLLSKCLVTVAHCRGLALDAAGRIAWAKAAVAADPKHFNGHNELSYGYLYAAMFEKALAECETVMTLEGWEQVTNIHERMQLLEGIVRGDRATADECRRRARLDLRGTAILHWQERGIPRPTKSCASCWWPGENRCSKCRTVYYCSRLCQKLDYKQHKLVCVEPVLEKGGGLAKYPKPNYPKEEMFDDAQWEMLRRKAKEQVNVPIIVFATATCVVEGVKRALMEGGDVNTLFENMYPVHYVALRNEPHEAVEIMKLLIRHGACPNVQRGTDSVHLLAVCRERAMWIDDEEPTVGNLLLRFPHGVGSSLEEVEREESNQLVDVVTKAIASHKLCKFCKARKQATDDAHLRMPNITDLLGLGSSTMGFWGDTRSRLEFDELME